jgi:hypothetical protein
MYQSTYWEQDESDKKTVIQIIDVNEKFKLDFEKYCF